MPVDTETETIKSLVPITNSPVYKLLVLGALKVLREGERALDPAEAVHH